MTTDPDDIGLERLLAEARADRPAPSGDLMARILADAEALRRERLAPSPLAPARAGPGRLAAVAAALGGWPALGALAASVVLGVGLGLWQPSGLPDVFGTDQVSVTLGLDDDPLSFLDG